MEVSLVPVPAGEMAGQGVKETERHRDTFERWLSNGRSCRKTAEKGKISERQVYRWMHEFDWHGMADEREAEAVRQANHEAIRSRAQRLKEHQQAGELLRRRGVLYFSARNDKGGWLNELEEPTPAIRAIKEGIAIERQAEGLPDYLLRVLTMSEDELRADLARTDRLAAEMGDAPASLRAAADDAFDSADAEPDYHEPEAGALLPPEALREAADFPEPDV